MTAASAATPIPPASTANYGKPRYSYFAHASKIGWTWSPNRRSECWATSGGLRMQLPQGRRFVKRSIRLAAGGVVLFLGGWVWQSEYDALKAQNEQLQQQNRQLEGDVARLQSAVKYTVNSDLL